MTTLKTRNKRFSHIALALALSAGTVGGMMAIATLSEPAHARGNGGGGGSTGGNGSGGENGDVMKATSAPNIARQRTPNGRVPRFNPENCADSQYSFGTGIRSCRYTQARSYRAL